jgi:putative restriction endonuclease
VWIKAEDPTRLEFTVALDETQLLLSTATLSPAERSYVLALTRRRLHQPAFRARVLMAYAGTCAMCKLRHAELLDAAHILPDTHPRGVPVVPNGLALCKIHHAAYDTNILGVRRDLVIEVQPKVLHEIDGPMLRYGLQDLASSRLIVPTSRREQPDPERLVERYEGFQRAS